MSRPNIVFILVDQMRADCLGVAGHPSVLTPNLDGLARRGTLFSASYSTVPSCIAARACLFTGLGPATHGRLGYQDQVPWEYPITLAGELSVAGYQTHVVGKTHFYPQRLHLGFQSLESYEGDQNFDGRYVNDYHEWLRERTAGRLRETDHGLDWNSWCARPSHLPEELHNNTWVAGRGIEFLQRRDPTRPFFLNLSFHRPHPPIDPPLPFFDLLREAPVPPPPIGDWAGRYDLPVDGVNAWRGRISERELANTQRAYWAQVSHIDNQIGRFLMALGKAGVGPTWVVFTSDHGEMLGDHHLWRKTYAYEGSARTPLIVCPPEDAAIHSCSAPVVQEDLMPTLLAAAGLAVPSGVEGRSLLPLLSGSPATVGWREYAHGEHSGCYASEHGMQYLTDGREKYIWYTLTGEEQLFDLQADPDECRDLAGDPAQSARVARWRERLIADLAPRTEDGLSDGRRLLPGRNLPATRPGRRP
jgi:arylsulfatase A-like enzyme